MIKVTLRNSISKCPYDNFNAYSDSHHENWQFCSVNWQVCFFKMRHICELITESKLKEGHCCQGYENILIKHSDRIHALQKDKSKILLA